MDRDEEERRRNRKPVQQQQPVAGNPDFEHFVDGSQPYNQLTDDEIARLCYDLFRNAPIVFSTGKGKEYQAVEAKIQEKIRALDITIPIVHIKSDLYLFGH